MTTQNKICSNHAIGNLRSEIKNLKSMISYGHYMWEIIENEAMQKKCRIMMRRDGNDEMVKALSWSYFDYTEDDKNLGL